MVREVLPHERKPIMKTPRKAVLVTSVLGAMAAGGLFGATVLAPSISSAATVSTTAASSSTSSGATGAQFDPSKGGHTANGITETLLTGDTATKAKAAALAAVPGGTIQRVETDAEGAKYEAHMTNADGSEVTVKLDASFKVTSVETGR
jgi:ABC-type transport system substrate-binding protein